MINSFKLDHGLGGNTKFLTFDQNKINKLINNIKKSSANTTIPEINNAPIQVLFQLGGSGSYETIDNLVANLKKVNNDQSANNIKIKFRLDPNSQNQDQWLISPDGGEYTILNANNSTVPIFVHDSGIWEAIDNQTTISGTNTNLNWQFPTSEGFTIDQNDNFSNNSQKGKGLKLQFTTNKNLDVNDNNGWTSRITNVPVTVNAILIRIVEQNNQFVYEKKYNQTNKKIQINLDNIRQQINVNSNWLNKPLINGELDLKQAITSTNLTKYENSVMTGITSLDNVTKQKIVIKYFLDNNKTELLDKNQLINKLITNYQNAAKFNILQLWNGNTGVKINATFAKKDEQGSYDLVYPANDPEFYQLDTSRITSTIEFDKVMKWLTDVNTKIQVNTSNNKIQLMIPTVPTSTNDPIFQNKTWDNIQTLFSTFGITIQYRSLTKANQGNPQQDWSDSWNNVNKYDENIGKFQIRFKFDGQKSKNIKLKLKENLAPSSGAAANTTNSFDGYLKIRLVVKVNPIYPNNFNSNVNQNIVSGNTRDLKISKDEEDKMLEAIKQENVTSNPSFSSLKLEVRYQLGSWKIGDPGKSREQFIADLLAETNKDQETNEISFKLIVSPAQANDFSIAEDNYTLHAKEIPNRQTRIKYFINKRQWESQANLITVSGTNTNLNWNFDSLNPVTKENGEIYLKNEASSKAMRIEFTTKSNANYKDPDSSDNLALLNSQWIRKIPTNIPAGIKNIKIRIIPMDGFIYEPATITNAQDQASVHEIPLTIRTELTVDHNWLMEAIQSMEIKNFDENFLNQWIQKLRTKIQTENNLSANDPLLNKININFKLGNEQKNYDVTGLIQAIKSNLNNYNSSELGIFTLWNSSIQKGTKINATFVTTDANSITLVPKNQNLSADLNTNAVYTELDITGYVQNLETSKTTVVQNPNGPINSIQSFNLPVWTGNGIFANKDFDTISTQLKLKGISIKFAEQSSGPWLEKNQITKYDETKRTLFLSFTNIQNNNLKLKIKNNVIIDQNQNNTGVLTLPLAVPRQVNITSQHIDYIKQVMNFGGDTKKITFNANGENQLLQKIKNDNKQENNNDVEYDNIPLTVKFSIGTDATYRTITELQKYLSTIPDDFTNRQIKYKFELPANQNQHWIFKANSLNEGILFSDSQSPLKIYINDKNIFNNLGQTTVAAGGTSDSFDLEWKNGIIVNETTGSLSGSSDNKKPKGEGLRIEFTFNENLTGASSENTGTDIYNNWVIKEPKSVKPGYKKLFIRIKVVDDQKYIYDQVNKKIEINLNIKQIIKIDSSHLNKVILNSKIENINDLDKSKFDAYEKLVWDAVGLDSKLKPYVKIQYSFDGNNYTIDTIANLIQALKNYENSKVNNIDLGILQLWNGQSGQKITTSFILADANNKDYSLQVSGQNNHSLDFSKFITVIDFSVVLDWLKKLEISGRETGNNGISNVTINKVPNDPKYKYFKNKDWQLVEKAFQYFGITIEYSNDINTTPQWGQLSGINQFDPNKGTFLMRFNFNDVSKSSNIKLKTDTQELEGTNPIQSTNIVLKLRVRLSIDLPKNLLDQFIREANITGNTKFIKIDSAKTADQKLIAEIKKHNGDRYKDAQLSIQYYLGAATPSDRDWSENLESFKSKLESITTDQTSNKIWYRFHLTNPESFRVDEQPKILTDHEPSTTTGLKIKYYINASDWETKASKLSVSGTSDQLIWNFNQIFGSTNVVEKNDHKIYLQTPAGEALQILFTTKSDATYDQPAGISNQIQDLNTKWISIKPSAIPAGTTNLKIKLIPNAGFVYESAEQGATPKAKEHNVNINIQNVIYVDKLWFNTLLVNSDVDISALNVNAHFNPWEEKIYQEIKKKNGLQDDAIARKIKIKYFFDDNPKKRFTAENLIQEITNLRTDYNNQYLGIVQLWNGKQGRKLKAIFESDDNQYTIRVAGINGAPSDDLIQSELNTTNIITIISMIQYIDVLKREKTRVELNEQAGPGHINQFFPPNGKTIPTGGIFDNQSYDKIANRLKSIGIKIEFSKDKNNWMEKESIKEYDIQTNALYLKFKIESTNIKLQLTKDQQIGNNEDSSNVLEIKLPLQVPKYIIINNTKPYWDITKKFNFNGSTKKIKFDQNKINEFIHAIKDDNVAAGGDQDYNNAPLEIQFQVGTGSKFVEISKLDKYLSDQNDDLPDRIIKFKFALKQGTDVNEWKIQAAGEYTLLNDRDQDNNVKLYINDKGVFEQLKAMNITGTNDSLQWNWPDLVKPPVLNESNGILTPTGNKNFGKGLKFEFTFKENPDLNAQVGKDPETEWVEKVPKEYDANKGFIKVHLRIKLTDESYYQYENINKLISVNLDQISQKIVLQTEWLNQKINDGQELNLDSLNENKIQEYEDKVKKVAKDNGINESLLNKFGIKYFFDFKNNNLDEKQLLDKRQLLQKINEYKSNKNQPSLGILQLWNQTSGIKIVAKFVDSDLTDKYSIESQGNPGYKVINTENIITTIDFSNVITWLTTTKKLVNVDGDDPNDANFSIPNIAAPGDNTFNGKSWSDVVSALQNIGIKVQYREMLVANLPASENGWFDNLNQVRKYDENIGKIQIRFKFENSKSINIKFKTDTNKIYDGKTDASTLPFELNLNVKLILKIDDGIVNTEFLNKQDVISGNTKYLEIKQNYQDKMIEEIKKQNSGVNNAFNNAILIVKYKLDGQPDNKWNKLNDFINDLKLTDTDQKSNKVLFKFEVENVDDFKVNNSPRVLFDPAKEQDRNNWKVKLFINNGTWEKDASNVSVAGKSSAVEWRWNNLAVNEIGDKVGTDGLEIQFTTKNNPSYDDQDVTENINDLNTKWINVKPNQLDPAIKNLWIRIKAKSGYVYGPAYKDLTNGINPSANIHEVDLNIKREILVKPINLSTSLTIKIKPSFVTDITKDDLDEFIKEGVDQVQQDLQSQVTVRFNFNGKKGLDSNGLYNAIRSIIDNNHDPNYGVLQLWNGESGTKIEAYYDLVNPSGQYELVTADQSDPKAEQVIITGHIKTKINLIKIVSDLMSKKIRFDQQSKKISRGIITINKWDMPDIMQGSESLNGISWEKFEKRLESVGVLVKTRVVHNPDNGPHEWKLLSELKQYDDTTLQLALRFELDSQKADNIILSVLTDSDADSGKPESPEFKMSIKAPATVSVDDSDLTKFTTSYNLSGNTKNLVLDQNAENTLIMSIYNKNLAVNNDVFEDLKDRLFIEYYLGKDVDKINESDWMTREQLVSYLSNLNTDQTTNEIWFRLNVSNPDGDDVQIFNINKKPKKLSEENISDSAKVKIFINDNGLTDRIKILKAIGSTDNVSIQNLDKFNNQLPKGLKVEWSNNADPQNTSDWIEQPPTTLDANKNLWIRFKSESGYVYENAIKTNDGNYTEYSDKHRINTDGLKVILKVKQAWLEKIKITNNTNDPNIEEKETLDEINKILPNNKPDLIELQYHIKGQNEWFKKDDFIKKLKSLKGSKDNSNFILKRDEIEVRFAIKNGEDEYEYALSIDNNFINENNQANYYLQLVGGNKNLNDSFEGYINIDNLKEFVQENFKIQGTTSEPRFIVTNREKLNNYFAPYASDNLFDIIYSTNYDEKTQQWTWDDKNSILNNGQLITETGLFGQATINPNKKFALKFISKNGKYSVYKEGNKENNGYVLDISKNVTITIEIQNPFTASGKTLGLWTREGSSGKYFQGNGGFKIVVANKNDFEVDDKSNPKSAQ